MPTDKTHRNEPFGIDIQQLSGRLILIARMKIIVSIRVFYCILYQLLAKSLSTTIRPSEFQKKDYLDSKFLTVRNGLLQFLTSTETRIRCVGKAALILSALIPPHQLNCFHTIFRTLFGYLGKFCKL